MNYRKDIYEKVKFMLKENPEANINCSKLARIIETIKGSGFLTAVALMCEIGDFSVFKKPK